ncbi:MAG: rod-binding protein [Tepidisphaeraceae bacterium]|jgi:Rod binding domain-containing protein
MNPASLPFPTTRPGASHPIVLHTGRGPLSTHDKLVQQTRKWVALSFFEPILKQMRDSPFHSDLLDGGSGSKAFASMYDERLAERMASDASDSLVKSIVRRIEGSNAYARHARDSMNSQRQSAVRASADRAGAERAKAQSTGAAHVSTYF